MIEGKALDRSLWLGLLNQCKEKSVFQSPEYADLINATAGQRSAVFALEENGAYVALVLVTIYEGKGLKSFFSKRGIIYGSPLFKSSSHLEVLLGQVVSKLKSTVIYLEFRNYFDLSGVSSVFESLEFSYLPYVNFELDLSTKSVDDLLKEMKYNRKREIRLSYEQGAIARCAENLDEVEMLYKILLDLYNTRVKLPLPSFDFFKNLYLNHEVGKVIVVLHEGKIIGGAFNLFKQNAGIYTMYYCGLREYHKKIFPTHLAIIETMNWAQQHDCRWLDFMGAGKKGEEYGVRNYKEEFGGKLTEYGRYLLITQPSMYKIGQWGLKILSKFKR